MLRSLKHGVRTVLTTCVSPDQLRNYRRQVECRAKVLQQTYQLRRYGVGYYNFWSLDSYRDAWLGRFLRRPRLLPYTSQRRIAVLSVFGEREWLDKVMADHRIFFTGENLDHHSAYADHLFGQVDLSLGFDRLDHPDYLRFPIWLLLCFPPDADPPALETLLGQWHAARRNVTSRPAMHASLVARDIANGTRARMADIFAEAGTVHYGGKFRNPGDAVPPGRHNKHRYIRQFPFNLCPENSHRDGYVTEKIFQSIAAGCVPLYTGPPGDLEPGILNEAAIVRYRPGEEDAFRREIREFRDVPDKLAAYRDMNSFDAAAAANIYQYYTTLEDRLLEMLG